MFGKKTLIALLAILALSLMMIACDSAGNINDKATANPTAAIPPSATSAQTANGAPVPTPALTIVPQETAVPTEQPPVPTAIAAITTMPTVAAIPIVATEIPLAPETNPPGDIPDTQAFVNYTSNAGGYELDTPEGWARTENGTDVSFADKLDGVMISITDTASAPTAGSVRTGWATALQQSGRAVQIGAVKDVTLPSGPAVLVEYTSNSEPNAVTGKQVRLENNAYLFYKVVSPGKGKLGVLTVWAPLGADNVDQWKRMSESFKWK